MRGILLCAFGKRGYGLMAHNLAFSLRDVPIVLYVSKALLPTVDRDMYHAVHVLDESDYRHAVTGRVEPAKVKAQAYRLGVAAGLDEFLYLDVDAVALKPIAPLLDHLRGSVIATEVTGTGGLNDIINYSIWATNSQMWRHFELQPTATLCGVQSSWMYFEKSATCDALQIQLDHYINEGAPFGGFKMSWGGAIPDEFLFAGCFGRLGIVPSTTIRPIFFGNAKRKETVAEVKANYHLLSIYGGRGLTRPQWLKLYDDVVSSHDGIWYPSTQVMGDKHANGRG